MNPLTHLDDKVPTMFRRLSFCAPVLFAVAAMAAEGDAPTGELVAMVDVKTDTAPAVSDGAKNKETKADTGAKALSGMSILGNQEAPKALVIVPWKSSQLGDTLGLSKSLDDARRPVDKDVFMRELAYYEIRSK